MKVGDTVEWTSQSRGCRTTKRGVIVAVVPRYLNPSRFGNLLDMLSYRILGAGFGELPRYHESYLVAVQTGGKPVLYWPRVKNLKVVPL